MYAVVFVLVGVVVDVVACKWLVDELAESVAELACCVAFAAAFVAVDDEEEVLVVLLDVVDGLLHFLP